jgi:hypothetical protein
MEGQRVQRGVAIFPYELDVQGSLPEGLTSRAAPFHGWSSGAVSKTLIQRMQELRRRVFRSPDAPVQDLAGMRFLVTGATENSLGYERIGRRSSVFARSEK